MLPTPSHPMMAATAAGQVPVASVVAYAGAVSASPGNPSDPLAAIEAFGWLLCDGRTLETAMYPELFAVLGYTYGGEGAAFAIPDYRGVTSGLPGVSYLIRYTWGIQAQTRSPF